MRKYLLPEGGKFYKANLHMHTNVSDGRMTPEETKQAFLDKGYSVVAFTDHEVMVPHPELQDENFLPITATEVNVDTETAKGLSFSYKITYHLNLYSPDPGRTDFPCFGANRPWGNARSFILPEQADKVASRPYDIDAVNKLIADANKEGMLVSYNHPVWSEQDYSDYIGLKGVWGVEWFNTGCVRAAYPDTIQPIEDLDKAGQFVVPLATDDAHNLASCFGGWAMIKADKLDYDSIFAAMKNGDLYSTSGPEIKELYIENGVVHVETSEAAMISLTTERRWTKAVRGEGALITSADLDINGYLNETVLGAYKSKPFFRITVKDEKGNLAYTRAYRIDEIYSTKFVEKE